MMCGLFEHFGNWKEVNKKKVNMTETETTKPEQKKNYNEVMKAYGQVYAGYLLSDKANQFTIKNIHAREWKRIFGWMKKNKYIVDFEYGHTFETACEVTITDFNEENMIYKKYCKGIEKNLLAA